MPLPYDGRVRKCLKGDIPVSENIFTVGVMSLPIAHVVDEKLGRGPYVLSLGSVETRVPGRYVLFLRKAKSPDKVVKYFTHHCEGSTLEISRRPGLHEYDLEGVELVSALLRDHVLEKQRELKRLRKMVALVTEKEVPNKRIDVDQPKMEEYLAAMEEYLAAENGKNRCDAGLALARLGNKRGLAIIINELQDKTPRPTDMRRSDGKPYPEGQIIQDRYYAALLLGQLGDKEAVPALIQATKDPTINYRAAISLGEIGDKSAIPALRKMAKDYSPDRFRWLWAGYGLAALGETEGFEMLTEVITSDSDWSDRRHAVEALGEIGHPRAVPTLVKALKEGKHANVRVSAARALGSIGDPAALPALTEALSDTEVTKVHAPTTVEKEARKAIEAIEAPGK